MKVLLLLMTVLLLQVSGRSLAQQVNLAKKNAELTEVFKAIHQQTGFDFVYTTQQIRAARKVSLNVSNMPLKQVLDKCFEDQPFTYEVTEKTIVVKARPRASAVSVDNQLPVSITGIVKDKDNTALPGVTIMNTATGQGTISDAQGHFRFNANSGALIRFTMVGYKPYELTVEKETSLVVTLEMQAISLADVVTVGYGRVKRENLTTAVSSISGEQITEMPASNLSQVFAGRLPGVIARTSAGSPGDENASLLVRTTNNSLAPLIVLDGVITEQFNIRDIDANEVDNITVLKDNAATAVYGARAANGVILFTTKRGKVGKPQFGYTDNFTWSSPTKFIKTLDSYQYATAMNEYYVNSGLAPLYNAAVLDTIKNNLSPYRYANTDWLTLFNQTGLVQNHSLNINGGSETVRYFISGTYTDQGGMIPTDYFKRYTFQNNLDIKLSEQFKAQANVRYSYGYTHYPGGGSAATIFNSIFNFSPLIPTILPNGSYGATTSGSNPLADASDASGYQTSATNYLSGNGRLTWEPTYLKGFSAYANFFIEKKFVRGKIYTVPVPTYNIVNTTPLTYKQAGGSGLPSVTDNTSDGNTATTDLALNYKHQFGQHSLEAFGLFTTTTSGGNTNTDKRLNLAAPGLDILNLGSTIGETTTGTRTQTAREGFVGRLDYNYAGKYLLEGSFREDASTNFAPGHRWGFFPGGSAAWILTKEKWFEPLTKTLTFLKLRGSVGLTGDDNISGFTYYYLYNIANTGVQNARGYIFGTTYAPTFYLANSTLPNVNITWAKNLQTDFGLDASLWGGQLGVTFDIYRKKRYDILLSKSYNLPATFGIGGPIQNFAKTQDKGFELVLSSQNRLNADWELNLTASVTYVKSTYLDYGTQGLPDYQAYEGKSVNTIVGYHSLGIFQSQAEINSWGVDQDGLKNTTIKPGDIKYADLDGDGKLTANDQYWIQHYNAPNINFGFGFDLKYKNFSVSSFFNGALGGYFNYSLNSPTWSYVYENSWRPGNENAIFPRLASSANNSKVSDATLTKDDFLRLRDLRIGYALPQSWLKKLKIKQIKIYAEGSNLITWTNVQAGIDPETPNLGTSGNGGGFYPNQRNLGFGVNVNF